jgi:mono/diheme cytochrome c family protein
MRTARNQRRRASCVIVSIGLVAVGVVAATDVSAAGPASEQRQVTFAKHIAPILQRSCQNCHRPNGGLAPMALTTFEEVRPWAKAIKMRTSSREMPPWFIEKNVGIQKFKDDISLSDEEIATIGAWVDGGALQGNPADMPPPRVFADTNAWEIGIPDLVVSSPLITVQAVGGDVHSPKVGFTPTGLTEDRWIAALEVKEFRPGEAQRSSGRPGGGNDYLVLHHQAISTEPPVGGEADGENPEAGRRRPGALDYTYEVGQNATYMPADVGVLLKAGGNIYFNSSHRHSIGKEVKFQIQIGFKLYPTDYTPKFPLGLQRLSTPRTGWGAELDIPGNADNVRVDKFYRMDAPARLATFEPHLHASGKRMCAAAIYPDGRQEMLSCAGYNHAWVKTYAYDDDYAPLLPTGTIVHVMAWYDNTSKNPRVVDPRNWRGLGHRSIDDMFIFLSRWIIYTEEEFKEQVAAREAKLRKNTLTTTAGNQQ